MKVLILGYASIVRRRALPAMMSVAAIEAVDVASRRTPPDGALPEGWVGDFHGDYAGALAGSDAGLVYIPLVNSLHEEWIGRALAAGKHVIVEKPACLGHEAALDLLARAAGARLCLAEATVFTAHPRFEKMLEVVGDCGGLAAISSVDAEFSFADLAPENFRAKAELGGGSLNDFGAYAAATCRMLFTGEPGEISCAVTARDETNGLDTEFSVTATYSGGRIFRGIFSHQRDYTNRLAIDAGDCRIEIEHVFSTPPELENRITLTRGAEKTNIGAPAADSFQIFFARVVAAIESGDWREWSAAMETDSRFLERMRNVVIPG